MAFVYILLCLKRCFGGMLSDKEKHIINLSDYSLSDTEKFVVSNGLDFCLPPKSINREEVLLNLKFYMLNLRGKSQFHPTNSVL